MNPRVGVDREGRGRQVFIGVMLILALSGAAPKARGGSILREVFLGIGGNAIADLTNSPAFPNNPSSTNLVSDLFEAPSEFAESYGQRLHGYVLPPVTGNYTFWVASDDNGELWLSTDENPANRRRIARVTGWTSSREWTRESTQKSAPIRLEAGRIYYIAALQKEGGGGDNLAVRWLRPDGVDEGPIPAAYLLPFGITFTPPVIASQPRDVLATEGDFAEFSLTVRNNDPTSYFWFKQSTQVGTTQVPSFRYGPVALAEDGVLFTVLLTNRLGSVTSAPARLQVIPDRTPPSLVQVISLGRSTLRITFTEPVDPTTAANPANYTIGSGARVVSARMDGDPTRVILETSVLTFGQEYSLTVGGVRDRAQSPNVIATGSRIGWVPQEFVAEDLGGVGSTVTRRGDFAFDLETKGNEIGGRSDQGAFAWQERTGDFDVQVRLGEIRVTDPWIQAGLMARAATGSDAVFGGAFAGSVQTGCFFRSRSSPGATASTEGLGAVPVNGPWTWLRLRRSGDSIAGFGSLDGKTWVSLGSRSLTLPATVRVGLALASGRTGASSAAEFRDFGPTASVTLGSVVPEGEPLEPSSRQTGLVFSEILYHPRAGATNARLEFIELYNAGDIFLDLSGCRIEGGVAYRFPEGLILPAGGFAVVAADPGALVAAYGLRLATVLGPFEGALNDGGDVLRFVERTGAIKLETRYGNQAPWPVAAAGAGHSLVLSRPSWGEGDPRAWGASSRIGGSPGGPDPILESPHRSVVINEFLAHTDEPQLDFIELHNRATQPVDIGGCYLSDAADTNRFRIPDGTRIPGNGQVAFDQQQLGFSLRAAGESLYFVDPTQTRVIDAVRFGGQENGVPTGRWPDGAPECRRLGQPTPGSPNAAWRRESIVFNEVMYEPISGDSDDEYVELFNRGESAVRLDGWKLGGGIEFSFPPGINVAPGAYLVVARDRAHLLPRYPQLTTNNTVGNYQRALGNGGDTLWLTMPDDVVTTNAVGNRVTNRIDIVVAELAYRGGSRWSRYAAGGGSSLELIDPNADPTLPGNWADSDETAKSTWTTVEFSGRLDLGNPERMKWSDGTDIRLPNGSAALIYWPDRIYVTMQGAGECLVDDVELAGADGTNVVVNGTFEAGIGTAATSWIFNGNHSTSGADESGPIAGARSLHLRSQGDGDTGINSVRGSLATETVTATNSRKTETRQIRVPVLRENQSATFRAKVRWLAGWPEVLFRTRGSWFEMPARMTLPTNLGTPGAANSRRVPNAGPAIWAVTHAPPLPRANEPVVVSCRISDPDGIGAVNLRVRVEGGSTTTVAMRDDGTGGDALARDGIYSATLTGRPAGTMIGFRIQAADSHGSPVTTTFPPAGMLPVSAPAAECYLRWGDPIPTGTFAHDHLWNSTATEGRRTSALNNTYREATLVHGRYRVIHNAGFRDKGSPYHGGGGSFSVITPEDEPLLGTTERIFRTTGNGGPEETALRSSLCAWIGRTLGIPYLHGRYMQLYRNGGQHQNVSEDKEFPSRSYARNWFSPDREPDLYKIAVWFDFQDDNSSFGAIGASLESFKSAGAYKLGRYRWNWQTRGYQGTANNYSNLFQLVAAANDGSTSFVPNLLNLTDVDEWMRVFAYDRLLGNWDAYGVGYGQNMYACKPLGGRWVLMPWDIDFTLGLGGGAADGLLGGSDPVINNWFNNPAFRRMAWRAYLDAAASALSPAQYTPVIEALRAQLLRNGISSLVAPTGVTSYLTQRRAAILSQVKAEDTSQLTLTSNNGNDFTSATATTALTGRAPFAIETLAVNGTRFPATWTDPTTFRLSIPLDTGTNLLVITGLDRNGKEIASFRDTIRVVYRGVPPQASDHVVINEIHYHPSEPGASFIELHNSSSATPFDLSGFRLDGAGYTFPAGSILAASGYLVLAADRAGFSAAHGATIPVFDEFPGTLDNGGETLKLVDPQGGPGGTNDVVISEVRYEDSLPWPSSADGRGASLQLIDPALGSLRVGNWAATPGDAIGRVTPGKSNGAVRQALDPFPAVWINEVLPTNDAGPLDNAGEREPYIELYNAGPAAVDLSPYFLADQYTNLTRWSFPQGTVIPAGGFLLLWADGQPGQSAAGALHTPFRLDAARGSVALARLQGTPSTPAVMDYVDYLDLPRGRSVGCYPDGEPRRRRAFFHVTPQAANNPAFPGIDVTVNEFMASNTGTLANPVDGKFDDWFELYNAGAAPVDLTGYSLTDDLTSPARFIIPAGFVVPQGGHLLVWADGNAKANGTTGAQLHTSFKLAREAGQIGLFSPDGSLVDGLDYGLQAADISAGRFPDGGALPLVSFAAPSPGAANLLAGANRPPVVEPLPPRSIEEGATLQFRVTASDPDPGQRTRFSLGDDAPEGATLDPVSGNFSWTPDELAGPGTFTFTLRATDDGVPARTGATRLEVTVTEVNRPPRLEPVVPADVDEGSPFVLQIQATDPDRPANTLAFSLGPTSPEGADIDPATGLLTWTPRESDGPGEHTFEVVVTDDGRPVKTDRLSFSIRVREVNNPPDLAVIQPQVVDEGSPLSIVVSAIDGDSPPAPIRYSLEGDLPSGISIDPATGHVAWTPAEIQGPGTYVVVVRATELNAAGLSSARSFGITVREANRPPTLDPVPDLLAEEDSVVGFTVHAIDPDLPRQGLRYSLLPEAPAGAVLDPLTGEFRWEVPFEAGRTTREFRVQASDDAPVPATDEWLVRVSTYPGFKPVINEIMYRPQVANAEYIELFNPASTTAQDLSGVELRGRALTYRFPQGARLTPGSFLVLAQDRTAFRTAHGAAIPVFDVWNGRLDPTGDQLVLQGTNALGETAVLGEVPFATTPPWPTNGASGGTSIQLIDARRDASRPGNWAAGTGPTWKRVVATGTASSSTLYLYLQNPGEVYLDDLRLVAGSDPDAGENLLPGGDWEGAFPGPWTVSPNLATSKRETTLRHGGSASLRMIATAAGTTRASSIFQDLATPLVTGDTYTLSYWYLENPLGGVLTLRLSGSGIASTTNLAPSALALAKASPGTTNTVAANLPRLPGVWINEVQWRRSDDPAGLPVSQSWIELVNREPAPVPLDGWSLSDEPGDPGRWRFPAGARIPAMGYLVIVADGRAGEGSPSEPHAAFEVRPSGGTLVLSMLHQERFTAVDALRYPALAVDQSYGRDPAGFPSVLRVFPEGTRGTANLDLNAAPRGLWGRITQPGSAFELSWSARAGRRYRVERRDSLQAAWTTLSVVTATADAATWVDARGAGATREGYYRVVLEP